MRKLISILSVISVVAAASAQQGSWSSQGSGYIWLNGSKITIDRVNVDLKNGGQASMRFVGPDTNMTASGSWSGRGNRVTFDIDNGLVSGRLKGDGAISFFNDRRGMRGISYTGTYRGNEVKISFLDKNAELGSSGWTEGGWNDGYVVPSWAVGEFEGHNRKYDADMTLTIQRTGIARVNIRFQNGRRQTQSGRYRDGRLTLEDTQFMVSQTKNGLNVEQTNDRENWTQYNRVGSASGNDNGQMDPVPQWMEGMFAGRNRLYGADMRFDIRRDGNVNVRIRYDDGRVKNQLGRYTNGIVIIENVRFDVTKTWNGIRLEQQNDSKNRFDYKRQ